MPPITVTVSWPSSSPVPLVDKDPIVVPKGSGATVIQWTCGDNVASLKISALDPDVFTPSASQGFVNRFSTTDANRVPQVCTYDVAATRTAGGTAAHDPRIENGGK
jgi:hypothetical protein